MTLPDFRDARVEDRTVLVRADLDVPFRNGRIGDDGRIARFAPTVAGLIDRGARVVVMGHLGRPNGVANPTLSLETVAAALADELDMDVTFVRHSIGALAERITRSLPAGGVAMLENLRFHGGEQAGDRSFAMMLSVHGDLYVNDAFLPDYGAPASIGVITDIMPSYAGPLLFGGAGSHVLPGVLGSPLPRIKDF